MRGLKREMSPVAHYSAERRMTAWHPLSGHRVFQAKVRGGKAKEESRLSLDGPGRAPIRIRSPEREEETTGD